MGSLVECKDVWEIRDLVKIIDDAHTDVDVMLDWDEDTMVEFLDRDSLSATQRDELEAAYQVAELFLPVMQGDFAYLQNETLPDRELSDPSTHFVIRLRDLLDELRDAMWSVGGSQVNALVHEDYFKDWIKSDFEGKYEGDLDLDDWPLNCIDWEEAADGKRSEYLSLVLDGETYLFEEV